MNFSILYYIFVRPAQAMVIIRQANPILAAMLVVVAAIVSTSMARSLFLHATRSAAAVNLLLGGMGALALGLLCLLGWTAVFHFTAGLMGGQGKGRDLLYGLALSMLPYILLLPLTLLVGKLFMFWLVCLWVWALGIKLVSIKELYGIDYGKATLTLVLPLGLVMVLGLVGFLLLGMSFIWSLAL